MSIQCLLWDFGDTLCRETFIWSSGREWEAVYSSFDDGWARGWNLGTMDTAQFVELASRTLSMTPADIVLHMRERCRHIEFFEYTYAFYKARHLPQAIVTVNPDLWTEVIVPLHHFDQTADVIISSWEEGTDDKGALCQLVLDRMGLGHRRQDALLIDNKQSNIDAWMALGGIGYHYTTDEAFETHAAEGVCGLIA